MVGRGRVLRSVCRLGVVVGGGFRALEGVSEGSWESLGGRVGGLWWLQVSLILGGKMLEC